MREKLTLKTAPRHKTPFVTKADTASDDLKARTLEAMAKREHENKEKAEQKKNAHRNTLVRAAAIAAIITLIIVVTPMRGYVASAAASAWSSIKEWINPLFNETDLNGDYPQISEIKEIDLSTQEILDEKTDFPKYSYKEEFKEYDENNIVAQEYGNHLLRKKMELYTVSDGFSTEDFLEIRIKEMIILRDGRGKCDYDDIMFTCTIAGLPQDYYPKTKWETLKIGTYHYPYAKTYIFQEDASKIEFAFIKNDELCFKSKYTCWHDNVYKDKVENDSSTEYRLIFDRITWFNPKYEKFFDADTTEHNLGKILLKIQPDNVSIASFDMVVEERSDYTLTDDMNEVNKLLTKKYDYESEAQEDYHNIKYYVFKKSAIVVKGYNPGFYLVDERDRNNNRLIEIINSTM